MILPFSIPGFEVRVSPAEPPGFGFEPGLFNLPEYVSFQGADNTVSFYLIKKNSGLVWGVCHFSIENEIAISPFRASFGAVEFAPEVDVKLADSFIQSIHIFLTDSGITTVKIKSYPFCYAPFQSALLTNACLQQGYLVDESLINHHIPVTTAPFRENLHGSERRRLKKCEKNGFKFQQEEAAFLAEAYALIKTCRQEKNKPLSLNLEQLQALFCQFPDRYLIFSVRDEEELLAVTLAVKVRSNVLLNFLPASPTAYNTYSPMVMLNNGLYFYCQENGFEMLDLGISGTKTDPHYSLMKFKEHLGALPSLKLHFYFHRDPS